MSGGVFRVLWPVAGLLIWGTHFGVLYAVHSLACERDLASARLLGLPFVPVLASAATFVALLALVLLAKPAVARLGVPEADGGEEEPRFRLWLAVAASSAAGLAILFQTMPALMLPAC